MACGCGLSQGASAPHAEAAACARSYRGYGQSQGVPSEAGIRLDAQAALDHLLLREDINTGLVRALQSELYKAQTCRPA